MENDRSELLENQDWGELYKRLVYHTEQLVFYRYPQFQVRPGSQHLALGMTCEDIAQTAIEKVISGERSWPEDLDLYVVLKQIVRSELSNLATKSAAKEELLLVDDETSPVETVAQPSDRSQEHFFTERWQLMREAADGDDDLELLLFAIEYALNFGEEPTRRTLASILDKTPQEVTNLKRRLARRVRKLHEKRKTL